MVWSHPGAVKLDETGVFETALDVTADLTTTLESGTWPIAMTLQAGVPGLLTLSHQIAFQRTHQVSLPGGSIIVTAEQVGDQNLAIPMPANSDTWSIRAVELTVSADLAPTRSVPSDTPVFSSSAKLLIDGDHIVIVRIPPAWRKRFHRIDAIQIPLQIGDSGAEVGGVLYLGDSEHASDRLAEVNVNARTVDATDAVGWVDLALSHPLDVDNEQELWLEINVSRG